MYKSTEHVPIEWFVTTLIDGTFVLMTQTMCCLDSNTTAKTPPHKHHHTNTTTQTPPQKHHHKITTTKSPTQQHHHKHQHKTTNTKTLQYHSILQSTTSVLLQYYKVLLRTTKYYSITTKYYSSTTKSTPVLLRTTKYYSSTPILQSIILQQAFFSLIEQACVLARARSQSATTYDMVSGTTHDFAVDIRQ